MDFPIVKSYFGRQRSYAFADAGSDAANLKAAQTERAANQQRQTTVRAQLHAATLGRQLAETPDRHDRALRFLTEEEADLRFIDKVLTAKEEKYAAAPLASKSKGWYTANRSAAEEKPLANRAAAEAVATQVVRQYTGNTRSLLAQSAIAGMADTLTKTDPKNWPASEHFRQYPESQRPANNRPSVNEEARQEQRRLLRHPSYINNQHDASIAGLPFGEKGNISDNGCGVVALYNVLRAAGSPVQFENAREFFNNVPLSPLLGGTGGLNPMALDATLRTTFGFDKVKLSSLAEEKDADAYIVLYGYLNKRSNNIGAHYVTLVHEENGDYLPLNDPALQRGEKNGIEDKIGDVGTILAVWSLDF